MGFDLSKDSNGTFSKVPSPQEVDNGIRKLKSSIAPPSQEITSSQPPPAQPIAPAIAKTTISTIYRRSTNIPNKETRRKCFFPITMLLTYVSGDVRIILGT